MPIVPLLIRNVLHPLWLRQCGKSVQLRYQREFERTQFLSADELRQLQWLRLQRLLHHAWDRCPFYRKRMQDQGITPTDLRGPEDLRLLPPLEKRDIQEQGPRLLAEGFPAEDLIPNRTGGSTGTPLLFYLDRERDCSRAAATLRHNAWAGYRPGDCAAQIWGAPRDRPNPSWRSWLRGKLLREPLWLDAAHLTEETMTAFHQTLCRSRPRVLLGYARALVLFARFLLAQGLQPCRPVSLIATAEVLEDEDRGLVEEVFGCPVFNRYGCREVSVIASECPTHCGMHIMAEGLYIEIETPAGPARPGEMGSILVTDLLNRAMPLIRYRIGDLGSWATGDCPCGRHLPRLQQVAGRVTDFLVGSDGRLVSGAALTINVVARRPSLGQVQIRQTRRGAVQYRIKPGRDFDPIADLEYLRQETWHYLGEDTSVEACPVAELPHEPSGKFLFSCSTVTPDFLGRPSSASL